MANPRKSKIKREIQNREDVHIGTAEFTFSAAETHTTLYSSYTPVIFFLMDGNVTSQVKKNPHNFPRTSRFWTKEEDVSAKQTQIPPPPSVFLSFSTLLNK